MLLTRLKPSVYMSSFMFLWGIVSGLSAVSTSFTGLLLTRFFLGIVEAPFYPGKIFRGLLQIAVLTVQAHCT